MTQASFLTPEVMSIVGQSTPARHGLVDAHQIRKFAAAIDDTNPIYVDVAAARAAGLAGLVAPPLFYAAATRPVPYRSGLLADSRSGRTGGPAGPRRPAAAADRGSLSQQCIPV